MLIQTQIQVNPKDYEFVKKVYKDLRYKSLSEYMREAINAKVKQDRKRLREQKRIAAMEMIGKAPYENLFESIEGEDFESNVLEQLTRMFGPKASHPSNIYVVDWKKEAFTSTKRDAQPLREHPSYGFDAKHFDAKLIFSGTESAVDEGGYLDGAVHAAVDALKHLSSI